MALFNLFRSTAMKLPNMTMGIRSNEVRHRDVSTGVPAKGGNWGKGASKGAPCAAACAGGMGTVPCIGCLGSAYDD